MRLFLAVLLIALFSGASRHPYYMGVTDLRLDGKTHRIGGSLKLFVNDLEDAVSRLEHKRVDFIHPKDTALVISQLSAYLKKRFSVFTNSTPYPVRVLGFEREEDIIWIYVEGAPVGHLKTVGIRNTVLYDFLPGQIHILNFAWGEKKWAFKLVCPASEHLFQVSV